MAKYSDKDSIKNDSIRNGSIKNVILLNGYVIKYSLLFIRKYRHWQRPVFPGSVLFCLSVLFYCLPVAPAEAFYPAGVVSNILKSSTPKNKTFSPLQDRTASLLQVKELTCESRITPLGIDHLQPRLGWIIHSPGTRLRNQYQSAFQILVASSLSLLEEGKADLWNSGKQLLVMNNNIPYKGSPLQDGITCYWKVRIWDQDGLVSGWSKPSYWTMGLLSPSSWQAEWVTDSKIPPAEDSLLFEDNPAPLFRKDFSLTNKIQKAVLYISGLGYYQASVNGKKIGDHFLDPGWTDYRKTIYYNTYDITDQLINGQNCIGVELGNGWYNPLPLRLWGGLNLRNFLSIGSPRFIARLVLTYQDKTVQTVVSDGSWKVTDGPLIRNNNYLGSVFDARRRIEGWNLPGYRDRNWRQVVVTSSPGGELLSQQQPPVCSGPVIHPVKIRLLAPHRYLVDMGRNFGGIIRLKVTGREGTVVRLRYGELLNADGTLNVMTSVAGQIKSKGTGGAGAPDIAWQQDSFIMGNKGTDTFLPEFTFHGFRYVEVDGYPGELTAGLMEGIPLHAAVQPAGSFYCSDSLFNRIQSACRNTFLSNLFSVQSDCPHREKLGYGGDIVATSEALMANFNMSDFYAKTIRDYADESQPDGGLPETAPYTGIADEGLTRTSGPIGWGTVFPLLLYQLYQYYGNTELLTTQYPVAKKWVDFLADRSKDYLIHVDIGDHESLDPKQIEVTGTAFFYYNTTLLEKLARLLGKQEEADHYQGLAEQIKKAFLAKFYDPETGQVGIHTQANQSFALYFHMLPPDGEKKALEVLRDQILTQKNNHLATGIFGTKYLLEVLSENDLSGLACRMAGQQDFPGWGYMLANGATTLWEHWAYSDNTFSHNHPMFGSVSGWFYKYLAGFRPDTNAVAYNKIIFQPDGFERLRYVKATYHSPQGMISSSWRVSGEVFYNDIEVPVNTTATVQLPASTAGDIRESGKRLQEAGITVLSREKGWVFCRVGSGLYHFEVRRFVKESAYQGTAKK